MQKIIMRQPQNLKKSKKRGVMNLIYFHELGL
jgi:hypothetical protein